MPITAMFALAGFNSRSVLLAASGDVRILTDRKTVWLERGGRRLWNSGPMWGARAGTDAKSHRLWVSAGGVGLWVFSNRGISLKRFEYDATRDPRPLLVGDGRIVAGLGVYNWRRDHPEDLGFHERRRRFTAIDLVSLSQTHLPSFARLGFPFAIQGTDLLSIAPAHPEDLLSVKGAARFWLVTYSLSRRRLHRTPLRLDATQREAARSLIVGWGPPNVRFDARRMRLTIGNVPIRLPDKEETHRAPHQTVCLTPAPTDEVANVLSRDNWGPKAQGSEARPDRALSFRT